MDEEAGSALVPWIAGAALAIETLAVAIIVVIVAYATARYLIRMAARPRAPGLYEEYRARLGSPDLNSPCVDRRHHGVQPSPGMLWR